MSNDKKNNENEQLDTIKELGSVETVDGKHKIFCLTIIGEIEGHNVLPEQSKTTKYEHIIPQLVAVEQDDSIEGMLIVLNTVGGDVEAGLAIAEMIASLSKPTVSLVIGGGHSIGVPIAVSADYSFIAESATMTIHPIRLTGLVVGAQSSFDYLEKMQERVNKFVTHHCHINGRKWKELLFKTGELSRDIGTSVSGSDSVKYGLIDEIGGLSDALRKLESLIEKKGDDGK